MTAFIVTSVCGCICYIAHIALKWYTINAICRHSKLSDSKVESISKMIKSFKYRVASS